jgi:hypothetical protein
MTASDSPQSPMARLVLFIVCVAIAASFFAGLTYLAVDLPAQKNAEPPQNIMQCPGDKYMACLAECEAKHPAWDTWGRELCNKWCMNNICTEAHYSEGDGIP